jgi:hypothetical protein
MTNATIVQWSRCNGLELCHARPIGYDRNSIMLALAALGYVHVPEPSNA